MPTEEERTFNEAMNEWAARQSFFHNTHNRLVHPDPNLPWPLRIVGYLFRLAIVAFILFGLTSLILKRYLTSDGFGEMMGEKIATLLKAEEFESRGYAWKGNRASTKAFSATGTESSFFKQLVVHGISFNIPKTALFRKSWELEEIRIATLDMLLRVGGKSELSDHGPGIDTPPVLAAGFGIDPDLHQLHFGLLDIADGNFRWGVSEKTKGSINNAPLIVRHDRATGVWNLDFSGGTISQNWWRNMAIDALQVEVGGGKVVFSDGELSLGGGGAGTLRGEIELGTVPKVNLELGMTDVAVESLIPFDFQRYANGKVGASIGIGGSPNASSGFSSTTSIEINEVYLTNIPVFEALSLLLESTRIRQLPLGVGDQETPSSTIEFETGNGEWRVTKMDIVCKGVGRLRGGFAVREIKRRDESASPDGLEALEEPKKPLKGEQRWHFSGALELGVETSRFPVGSPAAAGLFRHDAQSGLSWIEIPLDGPMIEIIATPAGQKLKKLTDQQAQRIINAIQANE